MSHPSPGCDSGTRTFDQSPALNRGSSLPVCLSLLQLDGDAVVPVGKLLGMKRTDDVLVVARPAVNHAVSGERSAR